MDAGLISWGRRVKDSAPPLWLFTDAGRMPALCAAVAALPRGLCGVVFRHDDAPDRAALARQLAKICRARGLALVVAGDVRLAAAVGAGVHLRGGRRALPRPRPGRWVTASAHDAAELAQARRAGAQIIFLSPVFPTRSHPGGRPLGNFGFLRLARRSGAAKAYALGGIDGKNVMRLGKFCTGAGAIDALLCRQTVQDFDHDQSRRERGTAIICL